MRLHVELQRRPRLLALTGGDEIASAMPVVESTPGGTAAVIEVPDIVPVEESIAWLEQAGLIRKGSARPEKQLGVLWLPGPLGAEVVWVPGDHLGAVGVTRETQRRGRFGLGVKVAVLDTDGYGPHDAFRLMRHGGRLEGDWNDNPSHSHATHVVGLLAGHRDPDEMFGVAPDVTLRLFNVLPNGAGSESLIASGYQRAVEWGAQIISASLGGAGFSGVIAQRVQWARQQGVLCISAAGNGSSAQPVGSPASSSTWAILAADRAGGWAYFTDGRHRQDASLPRFAAPGVELVSALPGNQVGPASGTSMSTPLASGLHALLMAAG